MPAEAEALHRRISRALLWRAAPWALAAALPWLLLRWWPGLALWALCVGGWLWHQHRRVARDGLRWLDAAVSALEDSSALLVEATTPIARLQQRRLLARLQRVLDARTLAQVARAHAAPVWPAALVSLAAAVAVWAWPQQPSPAAAPAGGVPVTAAALAITLHVAPPAYTGVPAFDSAPRELQVPEQSQVRWCLNAQPAPSAAPQTIELSDGTALPLGPGCATWRATESVFWRWQGQRHTLRVLPDLAPTITVQAPAELIQTLGPADTTARIAVTVRDEHRVTSAVLHLTLARGSGENIRFSDREMPLPQGSDPRVRAWQKTWTLAELGMEPGDELYFFVRARDNAEPRVHLSTSATYTLRRPGPVLASEEASALPMLVKPENLRSQRQIIIDTEQLLADVKANPKLRPAEVRARSEGIAGDQAQLRRRYGQFLGEESSLFGGDDDEHAHENEAGPAAAAGLMARFGHTHDQAENATLFDEATKKTLRRALTAMWSAEKALRAITPQPALPFEYRALEAIKLLQQADRIYLHRTAFVPPPLKEDKRLSGDVLGAASYRRVQDAAPDSVPTPLLDLVAALASAHDGQPLPALWAVTARTWIHDRITTDDERLAAQRAVQDVLDGCQPCRAALAAWLRAGITDMPVRLQALQAGSTAFTKAWRPAGAP